MAVETLLKYKDTHGIRGLGQGQVIYITEIQKGSRHQ